MREDKVDRTGEVGLRYHSKLYKIGPGRACKGCSVRLLLADQKIRVIYPQGKAIRGLPLDPSRVYQPLRSG